MKGAVFTDEIKNCVDYKLAKAKRQPFREKRYRPMKPFERIHSDLMGAIKPRSYQTE